MLRISIVEDDEQTAKTIGRFIQKYFAQSGTEVKVEHFADAVRFLDHYDGVTDVVFMDIELPGMNGMEAVKRLRERDAEVAVIFVTNLAQYAVSGYEVNAFDFIVKPVSYGSFAMKLRRLCQYLATKRKCEICVSTRHGKILLKASEIKYVEIMRHVVTYHAEVNLQYVTQIVGREVCVGGDRLLISAPRSKEFMGAFNRYLGTGGRVK